MARRRRTQGTTRPGRTVAPRNTRPTSGNYGNNNGPAWADYISKNSAAIFGPGGQTGAPGYGTAPGGPPVPDPLPDWQQIQAETSARRGVQYADAQATFDRGQIQRDFGYNAQGGVDPSNPYAKAALLERNFQQGTRGITNSMAAQGQLYAGSTQNAQNANTFNYLSDSNALKNQYSDALNQTTLNQVGAYSSAGGAVTQEKLDALLRSLQR